jgi:Ni,Fe-hydrogenase III large subunit
VTKWIIIGVSAISVILIGYIAAAYAFPEFRTATAEIAVTLLAVLQMIGAFIAVAILFAILYVINALNRLANQRVVPRIEELNVKVSQLLDVTMDIANNARTTSTTVTGTTTFISEKVAAPVIRASGLFAGVRATATALARRTAGSADGDTAVE